MSKLFGEIWFFQIRRFVTSYVPFHTLFEILIYPHNGNDCKHTEVKTISPQGAKYDISLQPRTFL